jgi:S1-C subfamily serine protease
MVKKIKKVRGTVADEQLRLIDKVVKATIRVEVINSDGSYGMGTGFVVGDGKYAVTAYHVVQSAQQVKAVKYHVGKDINIDEYSPEIAVTKWSKACIVGVRHGSDETGSVSEGHLLIKPPVGGVESLWDIDISVLKMASRFDGITPLEFDNEPALMGEDVFFIGYPGGGHRFETNITSSYPAPLLTKAIIASANKFRTDVNDLVEYYYWLDRPSFPGNSGGPVIRIKTGKVIGVISATPYMPKSLNIGNKVFDVQIPDGYSIAFGTQNLSMAINQKVRED